jgi:hypothetical protein
VAWWQRAAKGVGIGNGAMFVLQNQMRRRWCDGERHVCGLGCVMTQAGQHRQVKRAVGVRVCECASVQVCEGGEGSLLGCKCGIFLGSVGRARCRRPYMRTWRSGVNKAGWAVVVVDDDVVVVVVVSTMATRCGRRRAGAGEAMRARRGRRARVDGRWSGRPCVFE